MFHMDNTYFGNVVSIRPAPCGLYIYYYVMHPVNLGIRVLFLVVQFVYLSNGEYRFYFTDRRRNWIGSSAITRPFIIIRWLDSFCTNK